MKSRAFSILRYSFNLRSLLLLILGFGLLAIQTYLSLPTASFVTAAHAQTSSARPNTPIATIKFDVGRLEQNLNAYGQWIEYDFRGKERYTFNEVNSDANSLRLIGVTGNVELLIDFNAKIISGEWEGHPMEKLYTILSVDKGAFDTTPASAVASTIETLPAIIDTPVAALPAPSVPSPPIVSAPVIIAPIKPIPSSPVPVMPSTPKSDPIMAGPAPKIINPIGPIKPNFSAKNVTQAEFKGGSYIKKRGLEWIETGTDSSAFELRQVGQTKNSIFLYDRNRELFVELDLKKRVARSSNGGRLKKRHTLRNIFEEFPTQPILPAQPEVTDPIVSPSPTEPSSPIVQGQADRLSVKERFECRKDGGFIERAGMLGAERCTQRFSDGGNVCLDSRDCQGKCMTTTDAGKQNVSGKCQMTDNPFGCRAEVINGEAEFMLCVD